MDTEYAGFDFPGGREKGGGGLGVLLLSLLLCGVFFLSVGAYGLYTVKDDPGDDSALSGAVMALRSFVEEHEAVSTFLGFPPEDAAVSDDITEQALRDARVAAAARTYIREHEPR